MEYKALMLDIDGTVVPYDYKALPSERVAKAVKDAQQYLSVSLVTGRGYNFVEPIFKKFGMHSGFTVLNNGSQVMDLSTKKLLYDQTIDIRDAEEIIDILDEAGALFYLKQERLEESNNRGYFNKGDLIHRPYMFFTEELFSLEDVEDLLHKLSHLSNITLHKGRHKSPDKYHINISHAQATKLHGVNIIREHLGITKEEIIACGDGYNDFPLLMAAGLKVAMGNAVAELKEIADVIAPSVQDDGVAEIINRYILSGHTG